jgi:intracellular multiplication protein IcmK
VLDGIAPNKAKPLSIPGSNSQAWLAGDKIYLRTRLTLLSPAWVASMSSADGMNAYQIPKTPSILVGNSDGKIFNLRIEGY